MSGRAIIRHTAALMAWATIVANTIGAEKAQTSSAGELEKAAWKLYRAVWKEQPARVDAVISRKIKMPALSPADARRQVEEWFGSEIAGSHPGRKQKT